LNLTGWRPQHKLTGKVRQDRGWSRCRLDARHRRAHTLWWHDYRQECACELRWRQPNGAPGRQAAACLGTM